MEGIETSIDRHKFMQETHNRCLKIVRRTRRRSCGVEPAHDRRRYHAMTHEIARPVARPLPHHGRMGPYHPAGVPIARPESEANTDTTIIVVLTHASNVDDGELATGH